MTSEVEVEPAAPAAPLLEAIRVTKRFGPLTATEAVDFDVAPGEIHALLGENGAGKSTLMNILFGHLAPDEGDLKIGGRTVEFRSAHDAMVHGIGLVHQHFSLVPTLSVAENVALGAPRRARVVLRRREIEEAVSSAAASLGWSFDLDAIVGRLPVEARQRVEILKVLARDPGVLLFDEPTALLPPLEIDSFLDVLRNLRARGKAVVLVTHKLPEVLAVADRVTVLRSGQRVWTKPRAEVTAENLSEAVAGELGTNGVKRVARRDRRSEEPVIALEDVIFTSRRGHRALDGVSVAACENEIVGIAGVQGNGQHELFTVLTGLDAPDSGRRLLNGQDATGWDTRELREAGVGMVPADRKGSGVVARMTLAQNLAIGGLAGGGSQDVALRPWRRSTNDAAKVQSILGEFDVRPPEPEALAGNLSGGNQQKLLLARELVRSPLALIAANPTWGLDIKARAAVHDQIRRAADRGCAVLFSSYELEEVLELADRVLVIFGGRIALDASVADIHPDEIARAMVGERPGAAAAV